MYSKNPHLDLLLRNYLSRFFCFLAETSLSDDSSWKYDGMKRVLCCINRDIDRAIVVKNPQTSQALQILYNQVLFYTA